MKNISGLAKTYLKYKDFICPQSNEVSNFVSLYKTKLLEGEEPAKIASLVKFIYQNRTLWNKLFYEHNHFKDWGECFVQSLSLCAVLRSLGYNKEEVYVIVTCHRGELFEKALHASVIAFENGWYSVDLTKTSPLEAVWHIGTPDTLLKTNPFICLFNDIHSYISGGSFNDYQRL
ncbi:MAG: hypothetical protein DDT22_00823 [candidate division WS2 bacterium]|nr:hypothetical protein [Candidatus Lithacetigena glycinireducens]MBT9175149.1 hypothetical protein [Candidatus Lithacetigena glycinireducens]